MKRYEHCDADKDGIDFMETSIPLHRAEDIIQVHPTRRIS
jgi:hypothetical protein